MTTPRPKVSVVIAVYNGAEYLPATIESVLAQTGVEFELILVDDGSDQATKKVLRGYHSHPLVKLVQQQNHGLTKALIVGCSMARHPLIARLDVGDTMLPGRLMAQAKALAEPNTVLVCSAVETVTVEGVTLYQTSYTSKELELGLRDPLHAAGKTPNHASVMFSRAAYASVGGYRPQFYFAQDLDLWTRLVETGSVVALKEAYTQTVFTPLSISARFVSEQRQLRELIAELILVRRSGVEEADLLKQAEQIRPSGMESKPDQFEGNYFIGRCLLDRRSPTARRYLDAAIQERPLSLKARWARIRAISL